MPDEQPSEAPVQPPVEPVAPPVTELANEPAIEPAPVSADPSPAAPVVETQPAVDTWSNLDTTRPTPRAYASRRLPASIWLLALLVPYAIMSTIGLVYLYRQRTQHVTPHILESIPDQGLYEDFLDARRPAVVQPVSKAEEKQRETRIVPPQEPLDVMAAIKLGETKRIGLLEVTPVAVTRETLKYSLRDGQKDVAGGDALVLQVQVKNTSNLIFKPNDETFNRAFTNDVRSPVYSFLEWGTDRYYGVINNPATERLTSFTSADLFPGETVTLSFVAAITKEGKPMPLQKIKPGDTFIWRVHLRRGKEELTLSTGKKRSLWMTTVFPVTFPGADIK